MEVDKKMSKVNEVVIEKPKSCKLTHKWATTQQRVYKKKSNHYPFNEYVDNVVDTERICVKCKLVQSRSGSDEKWYARERRYVGDGERKLMTFEEALSGGAVEEINYCPNCGASINNCTCGCDITSLHLPTKHRVAVKTTRGRAFEVPFDSVMFTFGNFMAHFVWALWWSMSAASSLGFMGWGNVILGHFILLLIVVLLSICAGKK